MYAITGATGHTGNIIARHLLNEGQRVRAIGRDEHRLQPLVDAGAESCICDLTDAAALSRAFAGAKAAYVMIPPDMTATDYRADQERITDALAAALAGAGVEYAVVLSSVGADKPSKTGPVVGLHNLEKSINAIEGLNILHLRAGYFMENTLAQAYAIHSMDKAAGPLLPDLAIPMIATRDIGQVAADWLLRLDFKGSSTRELLGQRELSMNEAAKIIGNAIGKPHLPYVQQTAKDTREAMVQMGISTSLANALIEMCTAMNSGYMRPLETRSASNTTSTSYETFVAEEFVPAYEGRMAHA